MKISAVIITKNEEANIDRCLNSLQGLADQIIVVDSFSTDDTEAICKKYAVDFVQHPFKDYSDSKNFGNNLAKNDWIFSIDADEEVSVELKKSILAVVKKGDDAVYLVNRLTNYCGSWIKHCGWYPDAKTRLWKRGTSKWTGTIHETLSSTHPIVPIKGDLLHYSYPNLTFHVNKVNHFTDFMAAEMYAKRKKSSTIKMLVSPPFKFVKKYFFQLGFLDGYAGFTVSVMSAYYVFLKYAKLKELNNKS